jgi:NTP pyrophosphatase (non-canonical NTP hydrolase)
MDFQQINARAIFIRELYEEFENEEYGHPWTSEQIALGVFGDVGDLVKLILAENGHRMISDSKLKLEHELADCLWSLLVLAKLHNIDLERAFFDTMNDLERKLSK